MKSMSPKKIAWWEKQRALGKPRWIMKTASRFFFYMSIWMCFASLVLNSHFFVNPYMITTFFILGFLVSFIGWQDNEGRYKNTLLDEKVKEYSEEPALKLL